MSTTHVYTFTELATAGYSLYSIQRRAKIAGYTNPVVANTYAGTERALEVTVDENSVIKATLLSDIEGATEPTLSLDTSTLSVTADGVSSGTITVTDSRGASASGKVVTLDVHHMMPVDTLTVTLNGSGQGTFTFGPTTLRCNSCELVFGSDETEVVRATVAFT